MSTDSPPPRQFRLGILGYGEVGHGIAIGLRKAGLRAIAAYQRLPHSPLTRERAAASGVELVPDPQALAHATDLVIAVTQGTEALDAARSIAPAITRDHLYVDLASATPTIKRQIAEALEARGAQVADGAIEGSPLEHEHRFPIIASGPGAAAFAATLVPWGMRIAVVGDAIGQSAAIKGLRHVLMKGQIALLLEAAIAAKRCGISEALFASVAEWYDAMPFMENANRLIRTTAVHAQRRAEEAEMAQSILEEFGVEPIMTRGTVEVLRRVAALDLRRQLGAVLPPTAAAAVDLMEPYQDRRS